MLREVALLGAAVAVLELACAGARGASATEIRAHRVLPTHAVAMHSEAAHRAAAKRQVSRASVRPAFASKAAPEPTYQLPAPAIDLSNGAPISLAYQVPPFGANPSAGFTSRPPSALSDQEIEASRMATERGDHDFLMVDKALGKIILFKDDQPVFSGPALTGASTADELRPGELSEKFDNLYALNTKVTPAGRFTVARGYDKELGGPILDVSEIRGKDWGIAIHQVYLGTPSEHRDIRIKSPNTDDKHISFGCINVTQDAIRYLLRELPATGSFPLYILPEDASQTAAYFDPRTS